MTVLTSGAAGNLREQILSAAASCFRERGIKATKMQEIAKRAGISVGNFYNYFENKDAIIDEFAQREVARLAREIDEIVNGRVSLEEQRRDSFASLCANSWQYSALVSKLRSSKRRPETAPWVRSSDVRMPRFGS